METIGRRIETEIAGVQSAQVVAHVRSLLIHPKPVHLSWDYGKAGQNTSAGLYLKKLIEKPELHIAKKGLVLNVLGVWFSWMNGHLLAWTRIGSRIL